MQDGTRRKLEKFEREDAFMKDNAADFPGGSPGATAAATHVDIIDEIRDMAADQVSEGGELSQSFGNKEDSLDRIVATIRNMNRAANAFEDEVPGSNLLFRMPRNQSQQNLLATARAFHQDSVAPLEAKFIAYGLAPTFRADLQAEIDSFDAAGTAADTSEAQKAAATQGLIDAARRGMKNSAKLNAIVRIKYENDSKKLAAWTVASHLEKAPATKKTTPTP